MFISFHLDAKDDHALYSPHQILNTTSSKFYALLRLRIALILQFRNKDCHALNSYLGILQTTSPTHIFF